MADTDQPPPKPDPAPVKPAPPAGPSLSDQVSNVFSAAQLKIQQAEQALAGIFNPAPAATLMAASSRVTDEEREDKHKKLTQSGSYHDSYEADEDNSPPSVLAGAESNWQANKPLQDFFGTTDPFAPPPDAPPPNPDGAPAASGGQPPPAGAQPPASGAPTTPPDQTSDQPPPSTPQGRTHHTRHGGHEPSSPPAAGHQPPPALSPEARAAFAANFGQAGPAAVLQHYVGNDPTAQANVRAFLDTIAVSEGTFGRGNNGYNVKVGGTLRSGNDFNTDDIHLNAHLRSNAYGRYQIMAVNWFGTPGHPGLRALLNREFGFTDYSPAAQDAAAIELLKRHHALEDVEAGRLQEAFYKCRNEWASFPGSQDHQHTNSFARLESAFVQAGGHPTDSPPPAAYAATTNRRPHRIVLASSDTAAPAPGGRRHPHPGAAHHSADA